MAISLLALDLDGTLLNLRGQISERNLAAIESARAKGVRVALVTGRCSRPAARLEHGASRSLEQRIRKVVSLNGAGDQTRTDDLLITNQLLYQLSYAGLGEDLGS